MKKSIKYLTGTIIGAVILLPGCVTGLYLAGYMVESGTVSKHVTHKPSYKKLVEFNKNLGIGSIIFSVQKETNGSQSIVARPYSWVVLAIENDYVVVQRVFSQRSDDHEAMQAYSQLFNSINNEKIGVITQQAGNGYSSITEIKQYIVNQRGEPDATLPYAFPCNSWRPLVLSKAALLENGKISSYQYDLDAYSSDTYDYGYVASVSPANPDITRLCQSYKAVWLKDLKESRARYFSSKE